LDDPTLLLNEHQQQVDGLDDLVLIFLRQVLGSEQGLLGFLCGPIEVHGNHRKRRGRKYLATPVDGSSIAGWRSEGCPRLRVAYQTRAGSFFAAQKTGLRIGEDILALGLLLTGADRLFSFLVFHFDPDGLAIDFLVACQTQLPAGRLGGQFGFQLADTGL